MKNVNFQAVALSVPFQLVGFVNVCGARLFCPKCSCKGNVVASNLSLFLYPRLLPENLSLQTAVPVYFDYHKALFIEKSFSHGLGELGKLSRQCSDKALALPVLSP